MLNEGTEEGTEEGTAYAMRLNAYWENPPTGNMCSAGCRMILDL